MKTYAKMILVLLVFVFIIALAVACAEPTTAPEVPEAELLSDESPPIDYATTHDTPPPDREALEEISLPIVDEHITLTVYSTISAMQTEFVHSFSDTPLVEEIARRTGIYMDFIHPPVGTEDQHFNLMIAAGDLPDLVFMFFNDLPGVPASYRGGVEAAIQEGVLIDVEPLVHRYAPNFRRLFFDGGENERLVRNDSGVLTGFGSFVAGTGTAYVGPMIRNDFLNLVGLPMPETIDDWTTVLTAFRDELDLPVPFGWTFGSDGGMMFHSSAFIGAYGLTLRGFSRQDGVAIFSPIHPDFSEFLTLMNRWYSEGLMNNDFATQDYAEHIVPLMRTGDMGAAPTHLWWLGHLYDEIREVNPDADWVATPMPALVQGQQIRLRNSWEGMWGGRHITTANQHPVETVMFLDWMYTDEAILLTNWGIEGVTFNMVESLPEYTDYALENIARFGTLYSNEHITQAIDMRRADGAYTLQVQHDAWETWGRATIDNIMPVGMTLTADESSRLASIMTDIETFTDEMTLRFIIGAESLDNFESFVENVRAMGIDEAIAIMQAALDRYNAR